MNGENKDASLFEPREPRPKRWMGKVSWYLLVLGFTAILLAGVCFFLYRDRPLTYSDFSINTNVLGRYLLGIGLVSYVLGRAIHYTRRLRARKQQDF
jgi:hypothetical protein